MEVFLDLLGFFAIMTLEKVGSFTCIKVLNKISERMLFDTLLEPIEEHRHKLLNILLHHDID